MPIDYRRLKARASSDRPVDPLKLFKSLRLRDEGINDLWDGQGQALRQWHEKRSRPDIAIALNTGAGKTLIGLLIAQSLVNETRGPVLYACSSLQLVAQTAEKADGYGIPATTYASGEGFSNDLFERSLAPCITTYQALFNGKSRFAREVPAAVIFDDAHAAGHIIRHHFSLEISRIDREETYTQLCEVFRPYFDEIGDSISFRELIERKVSQDIKLVPPFLIAENHDRIAAVIMASRPAETKSTLFAWEYLRDKLNLCAVLITGRGVTFTPPFLPVDILPYFEKTVRRVYLSATLAADDAFLRAFGRLPSDVISPDTPAGECERMILFPSRVPNVTEPREVTKAAIGRNKVLVLVPSTYRKRLWEDVSSVQGDDSATRQVEEFKRAKPPAGLVLTARYDGVDLPGDTCRIMVLDGIPTGIGVLEEFLWRHLRLNRALNSTVATRITQSFGRISRGLADFGVVFVADESLAKWLSGPRNLQQLPAFLRKQCRFGYEFSSQLAQPEDLAVARNDCLTRDEGWLDLYSRSMAADDDDSPSPVDDVAVLMARAEAKAALPMWNRDYKAAIKQLQKDHATIYADTTLGGAWHEMWLAHLLHLGGDRTGADELYARAHSAAKNLPGRPMGLKAAGEPETEQVARVRDLLLSVARADALRLPTRFDLETSNLDYMKSPGQVEEALRAVGTYLGFQCSRPDKEFGTGPDVLWVSDGLALCIDAKSGKQEGGCYQKGELGQMHDHVQWVRDNEEGLASIVPAFAGPLLPACDKANPDEDTVVIKLANFAELRDELRGALNDICARALPIDVHVAIAEVFDERGLTVAKVLGRLKPIYLRRV